MHFLQGYLKTLTIHQVSWKKVAVTGGKYRAAKWHSVSGVSVVGNPWVAFYTTPMERIGESVWVLITFLSTLSSIKNEAD
jgi:hypothetical protein